MSGQHRAPVDHSGARRALTGSGLVAALASGGLSLVTTPAAASPVSVTQNMPMPMPVGLIEASPPAAAPVAPPCYTVAVGDTLSGIGTRVGEPWMDLYAANRDVVGDNPDLILPGQVLRLTALPPVPPPAAPPAPVPSQAPALKHANISNTFGPVKPQTQRAADAVVTNVPDADGITLGGTRASAIDPHGHPSGLAVDYMVLADQSLGWAIVQYHIDHWADLGVEYVIYRQHILLSPHGAWQPMADRGSVTANHYDHVHVNYLP